MPYIHDSCITYSMHVSYSILPILLVLIPYYLYHIRITMIPICCLAQRAEAQLGCLGRSPA